MNDRFQLAPLSVLVLVAVIIAAGPMIPSLGAESVHVAVLRLENLNRDPRYDYLEGMIIGVLMYDLTRIDDIDTFTWCKINHHARRKFIIFIACGASGA